MRCKRLATATLCILATMLAATRTAAQDYPSRNVTIVVPLAAGTGMDAIVRIYAEDLSRSLGKTVVVENQPGAAMMVAAQNVARAAPDGHTLVVMSATALCINPTLYKKVNYDPEKDFAPIALYAKSPWVLIVNPELRVNSMKEFIARARDSSAKQLTYATSGAGTPQFLMLETFKREYKFEMPHVPYRSSPQIVSDVVAGHVPASGSETGAALTLILDGKLKALGISSSNRLPSLPNVPTIAEALDKPGFEAVSWHVLLAPAATPKPIVDRLHAAMNRITGDSTFQKKVSDLGLMPLGPRPISEIVTYMKDERERWSAAVAAAGLAGSQ